MRNTMSFSFLVVLFFGFGLQSPLISAETRIPQTTLPAQLALLLDRCHAVVIGMEDYVLCPRLEAFRLGKVTPYRLKRLAQQLGHTPQPVHAEEAVQEIRSRMLYQARIVETVGENRFVAQDFRRMADQFEALIRSEVAAGAEILLDPRTDWAPSVSASAVFLIRRDLGTALVLTHGDTDG